MPNLNERAKEDHPWRKKHAAAGEAKKQKDAGERPKISKWQCPSCGMSDCEFSECDGGAF